MRVLLRSIKTIHVFHEYYEFDFHCRKNYYESKVSCVWALDEIGLRSETPNKPRMSQQH